MGLALMCLGLVLFLGGHVFTTLRAPRAAVIVRIGEGPYKGVYSLVALIGIGLISYGFARYRVGEWIDVWMPPRWTRHVAATLVYPAIICIVAAYIPGQIKRVLKHPMLVGVKLWAVAHLIANGDLGSIILFGSILAWAVFDRIAVKRRSDVVAPPTSSGSFRNDFFAVIVGTLLYFALAYWFHPYVIGRTVIGS